MSYNAQLEQRNDLIFIPSRPYFRKKWALVTFITLLAFSVFISPSTLPDPITVQPDTVQLAAATALTLNDKIVGYMQYINPKLDSDIAYKLAAALMIQSTRYNIPIEVQLGIITIESSFDQYAVSNTGALGFYQILVRWHVDKVKTMYKSGEIDTKDIYDPFTQAALGTKILYDCLKLRHQHLTQALQCYSGSATETTYANNVIKKANEAKEMITNM
jgi:soluble lytic murein transglycosylase-like protein